MTLAAFVEAYNAWQASVAITTPRAMNVRRVYKLAPSRRDTASDTPCWLNEFNYEGEVKGVDLQAHRVSIHSQLLISPSIDEEMSNIAIAFFDAIVASWQSHLLFNQTVVAVNMRGGAPTIGLIERGQVYIGIDLFFDVEYQDTVTFASEVLDT